jgi:hypothetical protein
MLSCFCFTIIIINEFFNSFFGTREEALFQSNNLIDSFQDVVNAKVVVHSINVPLVEKNIEQFVIRQFSRGIFYYTIERDY